MKHAFNMSKEYPIKSVYVDFSTDDNVLFSLEMTFADFLVRLPDRAVVRLVQLRPDVHQRRATSSPSLCHLRAHRLLRCH